MEGERRTVTMLFCDLKGSTAAASGLDPEEWAEIVNGAFEHLIPPIYRYEGTVARLMGDGLLAFFGAPIAHEDDPQRAVLAGLEILKDIQPYRQEIRQRWELDIDVRVGVNTGLVVVGTVGSDMRVEYTALGDAINVAARMEQTARPGTVRIAEATYGLVAPLFDVEDLGGIQVKGKDELIHAYRVLGAKAAPGRLRGIEGLEAPLIGRDHEMHQLRGAIIELRRGRGQIASVMGEAGLGKSRLIAELRRRPTPVLDADAKITWLEGRSLSYQTNTPYTPFADLLEDFFELDSVPAGKGYGRVHRRVERILPGQGDEIAPYLGSLLGFELDGEALQRVRYLDPPMLRERVFHAVIALVEGLTKAEPVALVIDDLHWSDPSSLDLLERLMPLTDRGALMLVALFRPARQDPSWRFHEIAEREYRHRYTSIQLQPLDDSSSRELVGHLLHIEDLPPHVRALILSKAEGNPFFVEEVIRSLIDSQLIVRHNGHWHATRDIQDIAVPDTLAAVILTRLDRLEENTRHVAQSASVLGRQFHYGPLTALYPPGTELEKALTELERRELIQEKSRLPQRVYLFKHALTQETAYQSLLLKTRRQLHARVGEHLEENAPERVNEIGRHFLEAGLAGRALPYLVVSGERAARSYSTAEAIEHFERALEILQSQEDPSLLRRTYEGLGSALTFSNQIPAAIEKYQEMLARGEAAGDTPMQVSALNKLAYVTALRLGQFEAADRYIADADQRAREEDDRAGLSELGLIRCMMCTAVADFEGVVHYMDEVLGLSSEVGAQEQVAMSLAHIASSQVFLLQFEDARRSMEEALRLSREIDDREHEAETLVNAKTMLHIVEGDLETAQMAAERGLEIARRIGALNVEGIGLRMLGILAHQRGEYDRALAHYEAYRDLGHTGGFVWSEAEAMCLLGSAYLDISPALSDRVIECHERALELLERPGGTMLGATAWTELGFCTLAIGNPQEAGKYFQKGLSIATMTRNLERPRILVGEALRYLAAGAQSEATKQVREARRYAEEHALRYHLPLIALTEARVAAARGDVDLALNGYQQAVELGTSLMMLPLVADAQAGAGRLLTNLGHSDEAAAMRDAWDETIEAIAAQVNDPELRALYMENARSQWEEQSGSDAA